MHETDENWTAFVQSLPASDQKELDLRKIVSGDRILVKTRNTLYLLTWKQNDLADLQTNSAKAPASTVRVMGCSFGLSSSIRPDALFCGGNLELTHQNGEKRWTTSDIEEIHLLHRSEGKAPQAMTP